MIMQRNEKKWRLPTISELHAVFNYNKGRSKIGGFLPNGYWSATKYKKHIDNVWTVDFDDGYTYSARKVYKRHVRCVRENSNGKLEWSKSSNESMTWDTACKYCEGLN